jgi:uncharacterized RDD family membrane protein YckC
MTTVGVTHFYSVDASGFRKTKAIDSDIEQFLSNLLLPMLILVSTLALGIALGGAIACLMWWSTKPDYEFGVQQVKLASLSWRGCSRLIDLGTIGFSTVVFGLLLTLNLDWLALADSLNMHIHHPAAYWAGRVAVILAAWLVFAVIAMLTSQAVWGITPGKWLCRLRTVRTSLRPCGFARSLAREIVFFVDCCNFICWTPGIVSIAFSDKRQRLGDFVADTIVVDSRSLKSVTS